MWLIRRMVTMWLILAVICAGVVLITRGDRIPDGLQKLGFQVCGSTLCYGNVRLGMSWDEAEALPNVFSQGGEELEVESNSLGLVRLELFHSVETNPVVVGFWVHTPAPRLPLTLGEMTRYLGLPCKISFLDYRSQYVGIAIKYEYGEVLVPLFQQTANAPISARVDFGLKPSSPISQFTLSTRRPTQACTCEEDGLAGREFCAAWQGFTNTQVYLARKAREARAAP